MKNNKKSKLKSQNFSEYLKKCPQTEPVYIEVLKRMDGEERLKTAFELYEIALNLCKQNILEQDPNITEKELKKILFKRFGYGTGRFAHKSHR